MQVRSLVSIATAMVLAATVPAQAAQNGTQAQVKNSSAPATSEKKVCRKLVTSGSRFAEKVCLTKEEWKKVEAQG